MNTSTASGTGTDGSLKELSIGAGGKKNRQKERRLMKGFNIAPQPGGSSSTLLEPVAELIASWKEDQHENSHHELYGSTRSEIFGLGTMPKKSLHHSNACRQSRGVRSSSKKKRWDTLIEAAKAHKVSKKFIGRSRSEDSVYSPASEDGGSRSEGSTDSKSSLEIQRSHDVHRPQHQHAHHGQHSHHPSESHHGFGRIAIVSALTKKRKKFSASRASTPAMTSTNSNTMESTTQPIASILLSKVTKKQLQRASSVPTRGPELGSQTIPQRRHEVTQSQQPSLDTAEISSVTEQQRVVSAVPLTPSTTEESMIASGAISMTVKTNGSATQLQRLPGIEPISGHDVSAGWL
ncbi:hypothetical protein M0802_002215 [Mischocyttarus mexicanus]|nr:hypothetical protein M0802_002215 [Mischocyttarus mexicanus]